LDKIQPFLFRLLHRGMDSSEEIAGDGACPCFLAASCRYSEELILKSALYAFFAVLSLFAVSFAVAQKSTDETPECNPARPTVATPATLTPVGYLQFENGGLYASNSPEFATQLSVNQVTKLALNSRIQLLALSGPFAHSAIGGHRASQSSDVFLGMQGVLSHGEGMRPTISASYIRRTYEGGAPDIDIGSFRNSAILLVSLDMAGFHFDINGMVSEQAEAVIRRAQFGQTISISHPVGKVTIGSELWHFTQPLGRGNAVGSLWAVSYLLRKNLVVDAGFNRGLTSTSTQWEGFAGFTYLLPHRLW
jgi:hypothetical protein